MLPNPPQARSWVPERRGHNLGCSHSPGTDHGGMWHVKLPLSPRCCSQEPNPSPAELDLVCYLQVPSPAKCKAGGWLSMGLSGSSTRAWSPAGSGLGVQVLSSLPFSLYR